MSTRRKKEGVCGVKEKEKGGTSPSPSHHLRSSANRSSKTSRSLDSSPSEKAIPNYLRPTLSSSGDAAKIHTKKAVLDTDSGLKPNLVRRRSFDKPPSPTCTSKARGVSPTTTFRSSSFSGKVGAGKANATTSPKGDRGLKGTRDAAGKQHSVYARAVGSLKKSATSVKTKKADQSGSGGSRKGTKNDDHHHTAEGASDQDTPVVVDQEMGSQGELIDEDTVSYEQQQQQQIDSEAHKANSPTVLDEETAKVESPVISEQRDAGIGEESDGNGSSVESPTLLGHNDADNGDAGSEQHHDGDDVDAEVVSPVNSEQHVGSSTVSAQVQSQHDGEVVSVDSPTHSEQDEADKSPMERR